VTGSIISSAPAGDAASCLAAALILLPVAFRANARVVSPAASPQRIGVIAVTLFCLGLVASAHATSDSRLPKLTSVRSIRMLSYDQALRGYPVHFSGVITYYDPYINHPHRPLMMVSDSTGTIFVELPGETTLPLAAGTLLDVTGRTDPGDFAPVVGNATVRILGHAPLPAHAARESLAHLLTGSEDAQWIEIEGVVESVEQSGNNETLKLALRDGQMAATTVREPGADYARLIDAQVRIRGVAGSLFNRRAQLFGVQMLFPGLATLTVVQPAPAQPFDMPISPLTSVMRYTPGKIFNHRIRLRGAVTLFWAGRLLCIQSVSAALCAQTAQRTPLAPGQVADVLGFPTIGNVTPTLSEAVYRADPGIRHINIPVIDAAQAFAGDHDAQLVHLDADLLAQDKAAQDPTIVVRTGPFTIPVILPASADTRSLLALKEGSRLRITGICSVQADSRIFTRHDGYPVARNFQIMLRSGDDIVVLHAPSWWTAQHTLRALALALAITLAVLCWVVSLRMRVSRQTEQLRYQATHDALTGIWNRRAVLDLLHREFEMALRTRHAIGILMLDADHFKQVNDNYGHLVGDMVLRELSHRIQTALRTYDLAGRYGGEEFLVILPGCTTEELHACAERVRAVVAEQPVRCDHYEFVITVSVGTAVLDPVIHTQGEALAAADRALYQAKQTGRNRVVTGCVDVRSVMAAVQ
jgi:diguanylate cyclase (GGDEF)-like protein